MSSRNDLQINKITKSLSEDKNTFQNKNKNNAQLNNINNINNQFKENNNNKNNKNIIHPLDFYALGKVNNPPKYISNYNPNKAFRSTSNDLINRNIFSLNSPNYDNLKKNKNYSILSEQNIKENNYLNPLEVYKTYKKYSLPSNVVNIETYNISKNKIFSKSNFSLIKKGLHLTHSNFMNHKNKLLKENSTNKDSNKTMIDNIDDKILPRIKTENNYNINNKSNDIKAKYGFDNNNDNFNSINKPAIKYINPIDYTKKELKGNLLYFDKNNQQFLRHKNWWKVER